MHVAYVRIVFFRGGLAYYHFEGSLLGCLVNLSTAIGYFRIVSGVLAGEVGVALVVCMGGWLVVFGSFTLWELFSSCSSEYGVSSYEFWPIGS